MAWVNFSNVSFPIHAQRFAIPLFSNIGIDLERHLADGEVEAKVFSALLVSVVLQFRPELAEGLQILAFAYNMERNTWEVTVLHPSLPAVNTGEVIDLEFLNMKGEREQP